MPTTILAETAASLSELKNDPMATLVSGDGFPARMGRAKRNPSKNW